MLLKHHHPVHCCKCVCLLFIFQLHCAVDSVKTIIFNTAATQDHFNLVTNWGAGGAKPDQNEEAT